MYLRDKCGRKPNPHGCKRYAALTLGPSAGGGETLCGGERRRCVASRRGALRCGVIQSPHYFLPGHGMTGPASPATRRRPEHQASPRAPPSPATPRPSTNCTLKRLHSARARTHTFTGCGARTLLSISLGGRRRRRRLRRRRGGSGSVGRRPCTCAVYIHARNSHRRTTDCTDPFAGRAYYATATLAASPGRARHREIHTVRGFM